jgi:hypothetical protein
MSNGYRVESAKGIISTGTGQAEALSWLERLRQLTQSAEISTLPYANPDVVALHRAGQDVDIALATTTAAHIPASILGRGVSPGLAWPPGGLTDDGTLDVMRAAGSRVVVLSGTRMVPSSAVDYTPSGSVDLVNGGSPLRALVSDPALSHLVTTGTANSELTYQGDVVQTQEFITELAMTCLELPDSSRTVVVAPPVDWEISPAGAAMITALKTTAFARPTTLAAVEADRPSDVPRTHLDYSQPGHELAASYLRRVSIERAQLALIRAVAPDPTGAASGGVSLLENLRGYRCATARRDCDRDCRRNRSHQDPFARTSYPAG